jgi:hypothetical protein
MAEAAPAAARLGGDDKSSLPRHLEVRHDSADVNSSNNNSDTADLLVSTAVERYLDENRTSTDPLSARQMRAWTLQWVQQREGDSASNEDVYNDDGDDPTAASAATTTRSGCLLWKGEYLVVSLHLQFHYGEHELHVTVRASAEPVPTSSGNEDKGPTDASQKAGPSSLASSSSKQSSTIRSKMLQRLSHDDYVSKILKPSNNDDAQLPILCEAHIVAVPDDDNAPDDGEAPAPTRRRNRHLSYEERYDTDEVIAEAIRRAVWGASSNDAMDVWEFVLQHLPLFPRAAASAAAAAAGAGAAAYHATAAATTKESGVGSTNNCSSSHPSTLSLLADRARLRLLEDAMCDACERHGDDGMVNELRIANDEEEDKEETHRGEEEKNDECGKSDDNNNINSNRGDRNGRPNSNNDSSSSSNRPVALPQQLDVAGSSRGPRGGGGGGRRRHVKQRGERSP